MCTLSRQGIHQEYDQGDQQRRNEHNYRRTGQVCPGWPGHLVHQFIVAFRQIQPNLIHVSFVFIHHLSTPLYRKGSALGSEIRSKTVLARSDSHFSSISMFHDPAFAGETGIEPAAYGFGDRRSTN